MGGVSEKSDWVPYEGPRGGEGWKNADTGDVHYGGEPPGDSVDMDKVEEGVREVLANDSEKDLRLALDSAGADVPDGASKEEMADAVVDAMDDNDLARQYVGANKTGALAEATGEPSGSDLANDLRGAGVDAGAAEEVADRMEGLADDDGNVRREHMEGALGSLGVSGGDAEDVVDDMFGDSEELNVGTDPDGPGSDGEGEMGHDDYLDAVSSVPGAGASSRDIASQLDQIDEPLTEGVVEDAVRDAGVRSADVEDVAAGVSEELGVGDGGGGGGGGRNDASSPVGGDASGGMDGAELGSIAEEVAEDSGYSPDDIPGFDEEVSEALGLGPRDPAEDVTEEDVREAAESVVFDHEQRQGPPENDSANNDGNSSGSGGSGGGGAIGPDNVPSEDEIMGLGDDGGSLNKGSRELFHMKVTDLADEGKLPEDPTGDELYEVIEGGSYLPDYREEQYRELINLMEEDGMVRSSDEKADDPTEKAHRFIEDQRDTDT